MKKYIVTYKFNSTNKGKGCTSTRVIESNSKDNKLFISKFTHSNTVYGNISKLKIFSVKEL